MKRNITIGLDEETARWVRVEAARRDESVSAYLGDVLLREREKDESYAREMDQFLSRPPRLLIPEGKALPSREELHDRS